MPLSQQIFQPKAAGAAIKIPLVFEFASDLLPEDLISSGVITVTVHSGVDAAPSAILSGGTIAGGTQITQNVIGGVQGVIYSIACRADTIQGYSLSKVGLLAIIGAAD